MFRVFVVSPLPAVRAGLRALLAAAGDLAVVGEAGHLGEAAVGLVEPRPDVVVLDAPPDADLSELAASDPPEEGPGLVVLGPLAGEAQLPAVFAGRAWGYLAREASGEQIAATVRAVANGLVVIDAGLSRQFFGPGGPGAPAPDVAALASGEELTPREHEVLQLVAQGLANKQIARRLGISEHTVKFHVAAILTKLGAGSRTEAVHLAARRGQVAL